MSTLLSTSAAAPASRSEAIASSETRSQRLMTRRVQSILLVSSAYDSFVIEEDGLLSEMIYSEYVDLGLTHAPDVTRVSTGAAALEHICSGAYDVVLTMIRLGDMDIAQFSRAARYLKPDLEIVLLIGGDWDLARITETRRTLVDVNDVYVFHGDAKLFVAIIKAIEDRWNADNDTTQGDVGVIILVEDSIHFRSSLLTIMYAQLVSQTRAVLQDGLNRMQKILRMRARNKILTAEDFESAQRLLERYGQNLVGVICDVEFPRDGKMDPHAGIELIRRVKETHGHTPALLQSSDANNRRLAESLGASFLHKRSPTLLTDVRDFMLEHFGFGDFVFRLPDKREVARASDLHSMAALLAVVPAESVEFHARNNHFSNWLRARTEFALSNALRHRRVSEFGTMEDLRAYLVENFELALQTHRKGVVEDFSADRFDAGSSFARIGRGSLGGKARGLAFSNAQLAQLQVENEFEGVRILVPKTVVIGTEMFDRFLDENHLRLLALRTDNDDWIRWAFLTAPLPETVRADLRAYLEAVHAPIAVRSSSLLEDSQHHPFAGVYSTHMIPNNHADAEVRLAQLCDAIKLVYASTYFHNARQVLSRTPHRIEEEKMAVILQPVLGTLRGDYFYPSFSGVALSYNYYPFGHMRPEDGVAYVALGLGAEVVEGGRSLRFSPAYPQVIPELADAAAFLSQSQREFAVIDLAEPPLNDTRVVAESSVVRLGLEVAEEHGTLAHVGSTYSHADQSFYDGIYRPGVRAVTFAHVLKHDVFPLAAILQRILEIGREGMNAPVELEFAVNMESTPREFAVLQIRPCVTDMTQETVELGQYRREDLLCYSAHALGNGAYRDLGDIVYVRPEIFDAGQTPAIAAEIGQINDTLLAENRPYLLIGPGRWGSSNRWLGVPVKWGQISAARVIVETTLEGFRPELSQGSHFFHNLTSFGIAYLTVEHGEAESFVDWQWLNAQPTQHETKYVRHIRLDQPLEARLDGRVSAAAVLKPNGANSFRNS